MEETSDTLRLAAEERAKQGIHELEFSFGGERDLNIHFKTCKKNPGHPMFIPLNELDESHLLKHPATYKIIPWIRRMSQLTVKLSVHYVSPNRPPGYPLSDRRGQRVLSVGSGHVTDYPREGDIEKMPCPFTNFADLPGDHEVFRYITIATAAHVVFDDEKAKNTTVEFFYDDPNDRRRVVTARGVEVRASSVEGDFCELLCVTHDILLIRELKYNSLTVHTKKPTDYFQYNILTSPRYTSHQTVKLSVNYVSPNRPCRYPLSDRRGYRVLSVGSGRLTEVSLEGNKGQLPCPFTNYANIPRHKFQVYITIATAAHVVFDDDEAKNTIVEFFYDDLDGRRHVVTASGVKVRSSCIKKDFCELVCVTHDELVGKLKDNYLQGSVAQKKRFCDLFRTVLPGLEDIQCERETGLKFIVKIRLSNPSEAVETLTTLTALTGEMVGSVLMHWDFSKNSLQDVLESVRCQTRYMHTLIRFELHTARLIDKGEKTTPFLHLEKTLTNLLGTLPNSNIDSPQMCRNMFSSVIIELAKYYSTVEIMKERLYARSSFITKIYSRKVQNVVDINNDTATVEVTFHRAARFTTSHHQKMFMNYFERRGDYNQWQSNDRECQPELPRFRGDECQSVPGINKLPVDHLRVSKQYVGKLCSRKCKLCNRKCKLCNRKCKLCNRKCKLCSRKCKLCNRKCKPCNSKCKLCNRKCKLSNRKCKLCSRKCKLCNRKYKPEDNKCKPRYCKYKSEDSKCKSEDSKYKSKYCKYKSEDSKYKSEDSKCKSEDSKYNSEDSKYKSEDSQCNNEDMLLVHIGHPHGQSKRVTIGRQTDCWTGHGFYQQLYTAPTCPGCSGGPVWMIPASGDFSDVYGVPHHCHHGNQLNSGCSWTIYPEKSDIMYCRCSSISRSRL